MFVQNTSERPAHSTRAPFYVLASEVNHLPNGHYRPFGIESLPTLRIQQNPDSTTAIISAKAKVTLREGDSFRMDRNGDLHFLRGPSHHENPFRQAMAQSRLKMSLIKISEKSDEDTPVEIYYPYVGIAFDSDGAENIFSVKSGASSKYVDTSWEVVGIYHNVTGHIYEIFVRSHAGFAAADILLKKLAEAKLLKRPSGMFDSCGKPKTQDESDEEYAKWCLKINTNSK